MCGIAGIVSERNTREMLLELASSLTLDQHSRGPDNRRVEAVYAVPPVIFGHNRLSIIDLSEHAHQPMWDRQKKIVVVFNGEIYNYVELREELRAHGVVFRTQSDTEVLIEGYRCWHEGVFERLAGMFAFALFDIVSRRLYLARDRFGKKPLFFCELHGEIAWASSSRMLARHYGLIPNLQTLAQGVRYRIYENDATLYEGLDVVPPGTFIKVTLHAGKITIAPPQRFYDLKQRVLALQQVTAQLQEGAALEQLNQLLVQAVLRRLRSDVPVGVSLSGGMDSSSVAALAIAQYADIVGFSFGHPAETRSEGALVQEIAQRLKIPIHFVWPAFDRERLFDLLLRTIEAQDAPFPTTSMMAQYLVYQAARKAGIKVILGGQGGDEALMGYRKFQILAMGELWGQGHPLKAIEAGLWLVWTFLHEGSNMRAYLQALTRYRHHAKTDRLCLVPTHVDLLGSGKRGARLRQIDDFERFSLPALLRFEDRNSMAHSVESRLPFMDHEFVEYAITLPNRWKIQRGYGKWALRRIMVDFLPRNVVWARSKRGFDETQGWISQGLGVAMRSYIVERKTDLDDLIPQSMDIQRDYSDEILLRDGQAFAELVALIWLARRRRGEYML